MLEVTGLSVKYKDSPDWALEDINFKAKSHTFLLVAGSSGSGKSTLAKAIISLIPTFEKAEVKGEIKIGEQLYTTMDRKDLIETIGYVPQYPADFTTTLLVEEEITFPLENIGFNPDETRERVKRVLEQLDIVHLQQRLVTELSAGELQKVALATALAPTPPILILDEPMARVDSKSEILLVQILKELSLKGHLIIAFEHRLDYILPLVDRIILLDKGKVIADDEPRMIIDKLVGIDIPEVTAIESLDEQPLSLEEAESMLLERISSMSVFEKET